jgi:hypothetical protein
MPGDLWDPFDKGDHWLGNLLHIVVMVVFGLALSSVAIRLYPFSAGKDLVAGALCGMIGLVIGDWIFNRVWDRYVRKGRDGG